MKKQEPHALSSGRAMDIQHKPTAKRQLSLDERLLSRSNKVASSSSPLPTPSPSLNPPLKPTPDGMKSPARKFTKLLSFRVIFFTQSFYDVYGKLGPVMLLAFVLSAVTMAYMALVQIIPNWTANFLMGTDKLDDGEFLVISKPPEAIVVTSAATFALFSCLYVHLVFFMLSYNSESTITKLSQKRSTNSLLTRIVLRCLPIFTSKRVQGKTTPTETKTVYSTATALTRSKTLQAYAVKLQHAPVVQAQRANKMIHHFLDMSGKYYRYYNALLDFPKLSFQTMSLETYLSKGYRIPIIIFYAVPLGMNWMASFYRFQRTKPDPKMLVGRTLSLFDLFFSVFSPVIMLVYAYNNFDMDRENFATREETLTPGSFDRIARVFVDPIEMELLKSSFANLQITDGRYIFVKCFLNCMGVYKWRKLIKHLILASRSAKPDDVPSVKKPPPSHSRMHATIGGLVFISCCLSIATYTALSISTSVKNCAPYSHCAVYSYKWQWGQSATCPCIVFIDRELSPSTFDEWVHAPDVTEAVRDLAANGYLQTVQIVNRALPELPEELRLCKNLKDLILVYTKTQRFPDWMRGFTKMEYFHVENDFLHSSLEYLPPDMFSEMHSLRFIRTGGAAALTEYPSLKGLTSLSILVLSIVRGLSELPNLDDLSGLTTLYVADAIHVKRLPSLTGLTSLKTFAVFRRNEICCNGWATGYCDLTNFQCLDRVNEPTVQCVSDRIPAEDLAVVERTGGFLCGTNITMDLEASEPTLESTDGVCQGILYKECYLDGVRGICYNGRMQVVHCDVFGEYEKMRRLQIARGVGDICDPEVEAWLGCTNSIA